MKGLMLIRNIFICFLVLVFAGCAQIGIMDIGPGQHTHGINADAIIIVSGNGKNLRYVSPTFAKKLTGGTTDVVWKIVPPTHVAKIQLCIKTGSTNPFSDFNNTFTDNNGNTYDHCSVEASGEIKGTIDSSTIPSPSGYLEFEYTVFNNGNDSSIDPGGLIYH